MIQHPGAIQCSSLTPLEEECTTKPGIPYIQNAARDPSAYNMTIQREPPKRNGNGALSFLCQLILLGVFHPRGHLGR
jgi:hypothetical protein